MRLVVRRTLKSLQYSPRLLSSRSREKWATYNACRRVFAYPHALRHRFVDSSQKKTSASCGRRNREEETFLTLPIAICSSRDPPRDLSRLP